MTTSAAFALRGSIFRVSDLSDDHSTVAQLVAGVLVV